jgi:hypothetical protein
MMFNHINIEQYAQKSKQNFIFSKLFLLIFIVFYLIFRTFLHIFTISCLLPSPFFQEFPPQRSLAWNGGFFSLVPLKGCTAHPQSEWQSDPLQSIGEG